MKTIIKKIFDISKKIFENSIGLGTLKVGKSSVTILYHVYHVIQYLDMDPVDYYDTSYEIGAIVSNLKDIVNQLSGVQTLMSLEDQIY